MKTYDHGTLRRAWNFSFTRKPWNRAPVASSELEHPEPSIFFSGRLWPDGWEIHDLSDPVFLAEANILHLKKGKGKNQFELWAGGQYRAYSKFWGTHYDREEFTLIASRLSKEEGLEIIREFEESAKEIIKEKAKEKAKEKGVEIKKQAAIEEGKSRSVEDVPVLDDRPRLEP